MAADTETAHYVDWHTTADRKTPGYRLNCDLSQGEMMATDHKRERTVANWKQWDIPPSDTRSTGPNWVIETVKSGSAILPTTQSEKPASGSLFRSVRKDALSRVHFEEVAQKLEFPIDYVVLDATVGTILGSWITPLVNIAREDATKGSAIYRLVNSPELGDLGVIRVSAQGANRSAIELIRPQKPRQRFLTPDEIEALNVTDPVEKDRAEYAFRRKISSEREQIDDARRSRQDQIWELFLMQLKDSVLQDAVIQHASTQGANRSRKKRKRGPYAGTDDTVREMHRLLKETDLTQSTILQRLKIDVRTYRDNCFRVTGEEPIYPRDR